MDRVSPDPGCGIGVPNESISIEGGVIAITEGYHTRKQVSKLHPRVRDCLDFASLTCITSTKYTTAVSVQA